MKSYHKLIKRIKLDIRRFLNKRTAYIYPSENYGWEKKPVPLIGGKEKGTFYDPCVRFIDGKFVMLVSRRDTKNLERFDSLDGEKWIKKSVVLNFNNETGWENRVNRASFLKKDGVWMLWYTGMNINSAAIGLAVSKDGCNFERTSKLPVLSPSEEFEGKAVMNPCVIWDEDEKKFKMWYSAGEKFEPDVLCYATSADGIKWNKHNNNPVFIHGNEEYDKCKIGGCDILKVNNGYVQYYIGYENIDNARICIAYSEDGISWKRDKNNPILSASKNSWDSDAVYKPTVYFNLKTGQTYLWYNGRKNHDEYIGMAVKNTVKLE